MSIRWWIKMTYEIRQGSRTIAIEPLSYGESIESFYGFRSWDHSAHIPTDIEQSNVSQLFLYEDPDKQLSLVVLHDDPEDTDGGRVTFSFEGLPADGEWAVRDDDPGNDTYFGRSKVEWKWGDKRTDGGAYRDVSEASELTVTPELFEGIDRWQVLSGNAEDPDRHELAMDEPVTIGSEQNQDRVSASVTTLQFIPGKEENPSREGNPLNSALMQIFPEDGKEVSVPFTDEFDVVMKPVFDNWLGGDMRDKLPAELEAAREEKEDKYIDDIPGAFKQYRFENGMNVSFETTDDGRIDEGTVVVKFNENGPSGDDPLISRGDQENSKTVLHDQEINDIPWENWYGKNERESNRERRYYEYDTDFEFDGVEGVRVITVWGGYAGFMPDISNRASDDPAEFARKIWEWGDHSEDIMQDIVSTLQQDFQFLIDALTVVPRTWSFIDFIVLADGRRYVKIWDASAYPSLYTYVDGTRVWRYDMPYESKERWNEAMGFFFRRAISGITPYNDFAQIANLLNTSPPYWVNETEKLVENYLKHLEMGGEVSDDVTFIAPTATLGFHTDGEPIDDPDEPFPSGESLSYWLSDKLPPN